jgi:class I fructose-bisphosphate aldolase
MNLSMGKRVRLTRLLYEHGPANGTLMLLPLDQGL